ncbi:MAG: nucleotide exchange factor GrpE, partial [Nitrospirae bacterium]|nr:nucleotide exchange factor GrpE [Nitrospirota bacterium]
MNETEEQAGANGADDPTAKLAAAEKQRDDYLDLLQRTRADFENYQKRLNRDLQDERRYSQRPLA